MSFTALYHGTCAACDRPILPGERIEGDDGEYAHEKCGSRPEKADCVCEQCFLVHAGECF